MAPRVRPKGPATEAELKRMRAFIEGSEWTFAKTMPQNPHEYTLRKKAAARGQEDEFEWFVMAIREVGYDGTYGRTTYKYLNIGEWKYWTMGAPLDQTILINRAKLEAA